MSNIKNIKTKTSALVMAGVVLTAAMLAAVVFSPTAAMAQENERSVKIDEKREAKLNDDTRTHRLGIHVARGAGIATDTDSGDNFRSGFRVVTQTDNSAREHEVKRGVLIVSVEGERIRYQLLPETWKVTVSEDGHTFEASGQVQNPDGVKFDVKLDGYFGMHTRLGNLWSIEGTLTGAGIDYELHYVAVSHGIRAAFPGPTASEEVTQ